MKFLIEGPDCSGKTTLANSLCDVFPGTYIHNSNISDDIEYEKHTAGVFEKVSNTLFKDNIMVDRLLPSEYVYGTVYRNKSRRTLDETLKSFILFDKIIFCIPQDKERYLKFFEETAKTREEYITDVNKISEIYDLYQKIYVEALKKYQHSGSLSIVNFDLTKYIK